MIIGLTGKKGAGKDTVADYLSANYGYQHIAFADLLRREVMTGFNLRTIPITNKEKPYSLFALTNCRDSGFLDYMQRNGFDVASGTPLSYRTVLQHWGDWKRGDNANYFVDVVCQRLDGSTPIVISDVRFQNEVDALLGKGAWLIRVERNSPYVTDTHASETEIDTIRKDFTALTNNGTLDELYGAIDTLLAN